MTTVVGGTFSYLHSGHKLLLKRAVETGNKVVIGLTTDRFLSMHKGYGKIKYETRKRNLEKFMKTLTSNFEITPLDTKDGNAAIVPEYTSIVVSAETYPRALHINRIREENGLKPLSIIKVPYVLAEDLFPISSTRIINGEIDRRGKRKQPIRISISTRNELKISALRDYVSTFMKNFEIKNNRDYETELNQPFGEDTIAMATKRALSGLKDNDYSLGIESGVFYKASNDTYLDFHYCVLIDREGRTTIGSSSGFEVPPNIMKRLKLNETISDAYEKIYGVSDIGGKEGIVGVISGGRLRRYDLITESIRNAFIPRFNVEFYTNKL